MKKDSKKVEAWLNKDELIIFSENMKKYNFSSEADYIRFCTLNAKINVHIGADPIYAVIENLAKRYDQGLITREEYEKIKNLVIASNGKNLKSIVGDII
jgi:hypothetical protein